MNEKKWIADKTEEMLQKLGTLVAIPSVRSEAKEGMPFGERNAEVLKRALAIAEEMGFRTVNMENYCGYAEMGSGEDIIGIAAHLDVVPAGEGWNTDPFVMIRKGDTVFGRGVTDDKGGFIASLYAMKMVKESGIPLNRRVRLLMGCAEETGSECMDYYVKYGEPVTAGFTPDGDFPGIHGEKGMCVMELTSRDTAILSMEGGTVSNAVCRRCITRIPADAVNREALESELMTGGITAATVTEEDGILTLDVIGTAAHASMPELGVNSISCTMRALQAAGMNDAFVRFYNSRIGMYTDGTGLGLKCGDDYGALTLCNGTVRTENGVIKGTIDIRYPVTYSRADILSKCESYLTGEGGEITVKGMADSLFYPRESEMVQKLYRAYLEVTGDSSHEPFVIGGGTYAKHIPGIIAFGNEFPGIDNHIHDANECLSIKELMLQVEIYAAAIRNLLK